MDRTSLHRVAEERSRALHGLIAERLAAEPELLERARARVSAWGASGVVAAPYVEQWSRVLSGPVDSIERWLTDPSEEARALRQVSPFAGAVDPRTRWRVWKRVRAGLGR